MTGRISTAGAGVAPNAAQPSTASSAEILFEDGKRCNLSGEQSRYDDATSERERPIVSDAVRQMINDERAAWMQMDRVKDGLINRLTDDREKLFKHLDRTTSAASELIENARDVLERAIKFQQRQFADYMSRATGQRQLEAEAFKEYQRTKRANQAFALVRDMSAAAFGALPTIRAAVSDITGNVGQALPKFHNAQQAMAFLHLTVQTEQLVQCFTGTEAERVKTATEVLAMFDVCSRARDERAMLQQSEERLAKSLGFAELTDEKLEAWFERMQRGAGKRDEKVTVTQVSEDRPRLPVRKVKGRSGR